MERYKKESNIAAPAGIVFSWHEAPDAFEKLTPPWERVRIVERSASGIQPGTRITLEMRLGPLKRRWVAVHSDYEAGRMFRDEQLSGPFKYWEHTHVVEPRGPHHCLLIDEIRYQLPFGFIGHLLGSWLVRRKLDRLFDYRHAVTREACAGELAQAAVSRF
jgi:ligand-binding SRPBCC domain-containing protein